MNIFKTNPTLEEIKAAVEREFPDHEFVIWRMSDSCNEQTGPGWETSLRCVSHRRVEVTAHLVIKDRQKGRIFLVDNLSNERGVHIENVEEATRRFIDAIRKDIEWIDSEWPGIDLRPPQAGSGA
jgi:hypothetical protein